MQFTSDDIRKCEELLDEATAIVTSLPKATEEQLDTIKVEEMPVLTQNAEAVNDATVESFIPAVKQLVTSLENAITAYKNTQRAAEGV